jgi:hypothetical protein
LTGKISVEVREVREDDFTCHDGPRMKRISRMQRDPEDAGPLAVATRPRDILLTLPSLPAKNVRAGHVKSGKETRICVYLR